MKKIKVKKQVKRIEEIEIEISSPMYTHHKDGHLDVYDRIYMGESDVRVSRVKIDNDWISVLLNHPFEALKDDAVEITNTEFFNAIEVAWLGINNIFKEIHDETSPVPFIRPRKTE